MESLHPEGEEDDTPFVVKGNDATDRSKADEDLPYAECPVEGCGELLPFDAMDYHIELHAAEAGGDLEGETGTSSPSRDPHHTGGGSSSSGPSRAHRDAERQRRAESSQAKAISAWKRLLRMPESSSSTSSSSHSKHRHYRSSSRDGGKSSSSAVMPSDPGRGKRLGVSTLLIGSPQTRELGEQD